MAIRGRGRPVGPTPICQRNDRNLPTGGITRPRQGSRNDQEVSERQNWIECDGRVASLCPSPQLAGLITVVATRQSPPSLAPLIPLCNPDSNQSSMDGAVAARFQSGATLAASPSSPYPVPWHRRNFFFHHHSGQGGVRPSHSHTHLYKARLLIDQP